MKSTASNNFLKPDSALTAPLFRLISLFFGAIVRLLRRRQSLLLESLTVRQQVSVLKRKQPQPQADKMRSLLLERTQSILVGVENSLLLVKAETVVDWHRRAFRTYWRLKSKVGQAGRKSISAELQPTIFRMARENPPWQAPRIHGELLMLGFDVCE